LFKEYDENYKGLTIIQGMYLIRFSTLGFCIIASFFAILCSSVFAFSQTDSESSRYIRTIHVYRQNVFPDSIENEALLYRLANHLHVVTKESVVRNELLFKEGDKLDYDITAETERKLRNLDFLGDNKIRIKDITEDSVDVYVYTQDQWSTVVSYVLESGGGLTQIGGNFEEVNFLGLGKKIFVQGVHESDVGLTWTLSFDDPQLFGSRWKGNTRLKKGPLIKNITVSFARPYISLDSRWAGGFAGFYLDETQRLFEAGDEVSRVKYLSEGASAYISRAFGERYRKKRIQLSYSYQNREFSPMGELTTTPVPDDELLHSTSLGGSIENIGYVKGQRIDRFYRTEDFRTGWVVSAGVTRTGFPIQKGIRRWEMGLAYSHNFYFARRHFIFSNVGYSTQFYNNTITSFSFKYFYRMFSWQTWAFNMNWLMARNLEESSQFLLGGDTNLRGFNAREFSGDKKLVMNLESRLFSSVDILSLAFGGVLFLDAGHVWKRGQEIDMSLLNYSVGFGLRVGITKAPGAPVFRMDFGYPLSDDRGLGIAIGFGQVFNAN
jgi:outer membrane protein assembly factor BamA